MTVPIIQQNKNKNLISSVILSYQRASAFRNTTAIANLYLQTIDLGFTVRVYK